MRTTLPVAQRVPTGQLSDTFFDDLGKGKSWSEIGQDLLHQAEDMANRVEHGAPGALGDAINGSGLPGASYGATLVNDVVQGKTPEQIAGDLGKDAAHDLADQTGLGDTVKDLGIDTSALNPLKPYGETLVNDVVDGKSPDEIAIDLASRPRRTRATKPASISAPATRPPKSCSTT